MSMSGLSLVTVTYHPDPVILRRQLSALPVGARKLLVDNGTPEGEWRGVAAALQGIEGVEVLRLHANVGLAAGLNAGMRYLCDTDYEDLVVLLDQDSEPEPGSIEMLVAMHAQLEGEGRKVGAVGPALVDPDTFVEHGFHGMTRWRWRRLFPVRDAAPVECSGMNGSGTCMRLKTWKRLGGLDESLFIDHVDTEWGFRLLAGGYRLYGVPAARFMHRMGDKTTRFWLFGWHVWPSRSPQRHYYLFRNAVAMLRRGYIPVVWKSWCIVKLVLTAVVCALVGPKRLEHLAQMARGTVAGLSLETVVEAPARS